MDKTTAGVCVIGVIAMLQCVAWYLGKDGQVFALTSLVIGGITGTIFGFSIGLKKEPPKVTIK